MPSVLATLAQGDAPSDFMAFALAAALRFLVPIGEQPRSAEHPPVFIGRCRPLASAGDAPPSPASTPTAKRKRGVTEAASNSSAWQASPAAAAAATAATACGAPYEYTAGLSASPALGTYEFRDGDGFVPLVLRPLGVPSGCTAAAAASLAGEVLARLPGFDVHGKHGEKLKRLACRVGALLHQMLGGTPPMDVLASLQPGAPLYLEPKQLRGAVAQEVDAAEVVDVHTHLFAAAYGPPLMEFGIDAMLTYHYVLAQYLATSDEDAAAFFGLPKAEQAARVWQGLFVDRSPLSEACRGILTTLHALGLHEEVAARDLGGLRRWYARQGGEMLSDKVLRLARVKYVVTSHDPFDAQQAAGCLAPPPQPPRYRASLVLDRLLEADWEAVRAGLRAAGEPCSLGGVASLLRRSCLAMTAEFLSAATPHTFCYQAPAEGAAPFAGMLGEGPPPTAQQVNAYYCRGRSAGRPAALRPSTLHCTDCSPARTRGTAYALPCAPPGARPGGAAALCRARAAPLAPYGHAPRRQPGAPARGRRRRPGAARRAATAVRRQPARQGARHRALAGGPARGDGARPLTACRVLLPLTAYCVAVLRCSPLTAYCLLLATHVLASKFRNLHLWGCWWYCNNPSVVASSTQLRLELLGPNFTFQASSARVHDQLVYKWVHARAVLTKLLADKYEELMATGWRISRGEVRRDVQRLLGGAYEEFLAKRL
eukprot:scaffold21035_cov64-Phaeocystis_antarctica.AAC.3